ncbi:hypothetical protein AYI69_g8526 [Smittium culicis]|uniref:Uncharacterized protein n=1 Tax=Smittium culicis TaxID=133412 RepID=A0A1R1XIY2_9FUNG|nr:hypothetical protein AYI69_g8526 [Smittium culicis]
MDQLTKNQAPSSQNQVRVLTELVQQLLCGRKNNPESEDPHFSTRISFTGFNTYPELSEALQSIEEDLFRAPLTEEEHKIAIHSCSKTSSMNYTPPPLKDTASSAENKGMYTSKDPEILFASTMRALLSEIASTVTQARLENLHKELGLPGKPIQLVESNVKPLIEFIHFAGANRLRSQGIQEEEKMLRRRSPKLKLPLNSVTRPTIASQIFAEEAAGAERVHNEDPKRPHSKGPPSYVQVGVVKNNDWVPPTRSRPSEAKSQRGGTEIQDGDADFHLLNVDVCHPAPWETDATSAIRAQKPRYIYIELMSIDSDAEETGNPESFLLKELASVLERPLVLAPDAGAGDFYRLQQLILRNSRAVHGVVCNEAQENGDKIGVSMFRLHNHTLLYQEIRGNNLFGISGINRKDMVSLHQYQHSPKIHICAICTKTRVCPKNTDSTNRMVSITGDILRIELSVWNPWRRPLCIITEQEAKTILQLVTGQQRAFSEHSDPQMDHFRQSVLLPTLESDSPGSSEGPPRASHNDTSDSNVEIRNLVPRPDVAISLTTTSSSSNNCRARSENRKVTALGKQELELDGLEDQRCFLKTQDLGTYSIDFIVSNKRSVRRFIETHRIDKKRSRIDQGALILEIIAPKEKRGGRPIEKPFQTNPHSDIILYPLTA